MRRIVFLHQSTGAEILRDGNVREVLGQRLPSAELWDYGFNPPTVTGRLRGLVRFPRLMPAHYYGLGDGAGRRKRLSFHVADTGPAGLASMFGQPVTNPPANALSHLLEFDVMAFKSCFTIFPITDDVQLDAYQRDYGVVRNTMMRHPNKLFVPLTPPPLRASLCTPDQAARARRFARWIMSDEFTGGRPNVIPFDLFDLLATREAEPDSNTLRPEYCLANVSDSHPNGEANRIVADRWTTFLAGVTQHAQHVGKALMRADSQYWGMR